MKKVLIILPIILLIIIISFKKNYIEVPKNSIRYRIIPHSNAIIDQNAKKVINEEVLNVLKNIPKNDNINEFRKSIKKEIPIVASAIEQIKEKIKYDKEVKINYGLNYFPRKRFKGITYDEGLYESLLIEIGEAKGNNFWCVLFPPLCMVEETNKKEVEYKFAIKEFFLKIKKRIKK